MPDYAHNPNFMTPHYGTELYLNEAGDVMTLRMKNKPLPVNFHAIAAAVALAFVLGIIVGIL